MFFESCRCSKDEAWRWLVKGGQTRSELFSRTKDRKIYSSLSTVLIPISPFYLYESIRMAKCVQFLEFKHIFFFSRGNREIFPKCIANARGEEACLGKAREQFFIRKDRRRSPPEGERLKPASEIWQDGWFPRTWARNVEGAIVSRNGNHRHQRDVKEFHAISSFLRADVGNRRSGQSRPCGKFYRNSIEKLLTNTTSTFSFSPRLEIFCQDCATLLQICVCRL